MSSKRKKPAAPEPIVEEEENFSSSEGEESDDQHGNDSHLLDRDDDDDGITLFFLYSVSLTDFLCDVFTYVSSSEVDEEELEAYRRLMNKNFHNGEESSQRVNPSTNEKGRVKEFKLDQVEKCMCPAAISQDNVTLRPLLLLAWRIYA